MHQPSPAHRILLQAAHRAIAISIWLLVAKLIFTVWGRPFAGAIHLLPIAAALLIFASLFSLGVLWTTHDHDQTLAQSHRLTQAAAVFLAITLAGCILFNHL